MNYLSVLTHNNSIDVSNNNLNMKPGWSYINKKTKQIYRNSTLPNKSLNNDVSLSHYEIINIYHNLSNHWDNFRDKDIELYGDLSIYYDYKNILNKILNEEEMIYNKIYNINNKKDDDVNSYSDDDRY